MDNRKQRLTGVILMNSVNDMIVDPTNSSTDKPTAVSAAIIDKPVYLHGAVWLMFLSACLCTNNIMAAGEVLVQLEDYFY